MLGVPGACGTHDHGQGPPPLLPSSFLPVFCFHFFPSRSLPIQATKFSPFILPHSVPCPPSHGCCHTVTFPHLSLSLATLLLLPLQSTALLCHLIPLAGTGVQHCHLPQNILTGGGRKLAAAAHPAWCGCRHWSPASPEVPTLSAERESQRETTRPATAARSLPTPHKPRLAPVT